MKTLLSAAAALAIIVGSSAAFADGGDGAATPRWNGLPVTLPSTAYAAAPVTNEGNSAAEPVFNGAPAIVALNNSGGLWATGTEAPLQTANSAPPGFLNGTSGAVFAALPVGVGHLALR